MTVLTREGRSGRISGLGVDESYSESVRLDGNKTTAKEIAAELNRMRLVFSPAVARAKQDDPVFDKVYTVEQGYFRTRQFDIICTVCVTRTQ